MSDNKVLNAIGIVAVIAVVALVIKMINKKTETKLYSDDAYDDLQDSDKLDKLGNAVSSYHESGKWDETKLF